MGSLKQLVSLRLQTSNLRSLAINLEKIEDEPVGEESEVVVVVSAVVVLAMTPVFVLVNTLSKMLLSGGGDLVRQV